MAIKLNKTTYHGINLPESYIRLTELKTTRTSVEMQFTVYKDQEAFINNMPPIEFIHKQLGAGSPEIVAVAGVAPVAEVLDAEGVVVTEAVLEVREVIGIPAVPSMADYFDVAILDGQGLNPVKQAYLYLMTLEEFSTGVEI